MPVVRPPEAEMSVEAQLSGTDPIFGPDEGQPLAHAQTELNDRRRGCALDETVSRGEKCGHVKPEAALPSKAIEMTGERAVRQLGCVDSTLSGRA